MTKKASIKKFKHYLSASLLTTIAGIISFPILTRILTKADYGIYSLIQGGQLIYEAIVKCGGQLSALRFYPEMMKGNPSLKNIYISNIILLPLFISFCVSSFLVVGLICYSLLYNPVYLYILVVIAAQASILISFFHSLMQASGKSRIDAFISVLNKYLYLLIVIPTVLYLSSNYWGVYWSICISSVIAAIVVIYLNRTVFSGFKFILDVEHVKKSIKYAFPLVLTEISAISMAFVDRFVMALVGLDLAMIGIYSIGMGLANVFFILIWKTIQPLIFPRINEIHDNQSISLAVQRLGESANFYIILILAIFVGIYLNSKDFLVILSGEDKIEASIFFFFGIVILLFKLLSNFLYYGFELSKKTDVIFKSELMISLINLGLNILLIPIVGIYGAVISSLISIPCGMLYKNYKLDNKYKISGLFSGVWKVVFLLIIYGSIHILVIKPCLDSEITRLSASVLLFSIIFYFGRKAWFEKFHSVFSSH